MSTQELLIKANKYKGYLSALSSNQKNEILNTMADKLIEYSDYILSENKKDLEAAKDKINEIMLDRLKLTDKRIKDMALGIKKVTTLPDPVGCLLSETIRDDGLKIQKVSTPLGVVAIIYESRPNVTSDAAALTLKSGNVCVLRSGKEAHNSSAAIVEVLQKALAELNHPKELINIIEDTSRNSAYELMNAVGLVDLLIPRGGKGLIDSCVANAKVPCIQTGTGICHIYVDESADFDMALNIIENAKTSRPSVCNACEVCLINASIAEKFLPLLKQRLVDNRKEFPVELRLDNIALSIINGTKATEEDFHTEFLNYILAIKVVQNINEAIIHINSHSTGHSEAIITENKNNATLFTSSIDSAAVYVNASTRFTDGGEFGLGCEMGISTQKLHARGPMGLAELTSYKYIITGKGNIR